MLGIFKRNKIESKIYEKCKNLKHGIDKNSYSLDDDETFTFMFFMCIGMFIDPKQNDEPYSKYFNDYTLFEIGCYVYSQLQNDADLYLQKIRVSENQLLGNLKITALIASAMASLLAFYAENVNKYVDFNSIQLNRHRLYTDVFIKKDEQYEPYSAIDILLPSILQTKNKNKSKNYTKIPPPPLELDAIVMSPYVANYMNTVYPIIWAGLQKKIDSICNVA